MTSVYVNYDERHISGGEVGEGQEDDAYAFREPSYNDFSIYGVSLNQTTAYHAQFEVEDPVPEVLYVVHVRYSTGSTFGTSYGHGIIIDVFKNEKDAKRAVERIESDDPSYVPPCGYKCWVGYFESLESVQYESFKVN